MSSEPDPGTTRAGPPQQRPSPTQSLAQAQAEPSSAPSPPPSPRTRVRRMPLRARYDRAALHEIVDAAYLCHCAFADEHGVHNIPTACWRDGDWLYVHGSNGSRMLKVAAAGAQVCVTITHLDGLVLARSAFHHSMNYRSAVIYGVFEVVDGAAKARAMDAFVDHVAPGRSRDVRGGDANELAATTVLRLRLDEAATKCRTGGPLDDEADMSVPAWAGTLPMALRPLPPVCDAAPGGTPTYVRAWEQAAGPSPA